MKIGIFIFRRDLRIYDNKGLNELQKYVDIIIPIFILDEQQIIKNNKNKYYFSNNAVQFMCESLIDLNNQLNKIKSKLYLFFGNPIEILNNIISQFKHNNIYIGFNSDFSIYSNKRDNLIKQNFQNIIITTNDFYLSDIYSIHQIKQGYYKQFKPFYIKALQFIINKEETQLLKKFYNKNINGEFNINELNKFYQFNEHLKLKGGRNNIKKIYSPYLNFGCISIRETYNKFHNNKEYIRKLIWRDFFLQLFIFEPKASLYNKHINNNYDENIKWKNNKNDWISLINGKTGFLLIDAIMIEMKTTGFIENKNRLLLGYFWTKYLVINPFHPKYGSQVGFSKYLVDAIGSIQNKMNHHWLTELDYAGKRFSKPGIPLTGRPITINNKIIKKIDTNCTYIKKWLPHLINVSNEDIYNWKPNIIYSYNEWINACKI